MSNTRQRSYQSPDVVDMGLVSDLTHGGGGSSTDMDSTCIPVTVPGPSQDSDDLDIPDRRS